MSIVAHNALILFVLKNFNALLFYEIFYSILVQWKWNILKYKYYWKIIMLYIFSAYYIIYVQTFLVV